MNISYLSSDCLAKSSAAILFVKPYKVGGHLIKKAFQSKASFQLLQPNVKPGTIFKERVKMLFVGFALLVPIINSIAMLILRCLEHKASSQKVKSTIKNGSAGKKPKDPILKTDVKEAEVLKAKAKIALKMQSNYRGRKARKKFVAMKAAISKTKPIINSIIKSAVAQISKKEKAVIEVQAMIRRKIARRNFKKVQSAVLMIQFAFRKVKKHIMQKKVGAVILIQRAFRAQKAKAKRPAPTPPKVSVNIPTHISEPKIKEQHLMPPVLRETPVAGMGGHSMGINCSFDDYVIVKRANEAIASIDAEIRSIKPALLTAAKAGHIHKLGPLRHDILELTNKKSVHQRILQQLGHPIEG